MIGNLSKALSYTLNSLPRGKNFNGQITNSCSVPFRHVTVDENSDCFICNCHGWLPIPVGKILDFNSLDEVWNSPTSKILQQDIAEKKFTWCAVQHCGIINRDNTNNGGYTLSLNIDNSCNLACPSCRRELYMLESGTEFDNKMQELERVQIWLQKFEHPITILLGGTGDALASRILRTFIKNYQYKKGQTFCITTNGLLLKKIIGDSSIFPAISKYSISVDAATAEVYEKVRRPGKWEVLIENLNWLVDNRQNSEVRLNFVIQKTNFRDLPAFVELCKKYNFIGNISTLDDWGTWNSKPVKNPDSYTLANGTYLDHNVDDVNHPEHEEFVKILKTVQQSKFNHINISPYFNKYQ